MFGLGYPTIFYPCYKENSEQSLMAVDENDTAILFQRNIDLQELISVSGDSQFLYIALDSNPIRDAALIRASKAFNRAAVLACVRGIHAQDWSINYMKMNSSHINGYCIDRKTIDTWESLNSLLRYLITGDRIWDDMSYILIDVKIEDIETIRPRDRKQYLSKFTAIIPQYISEENLNEWTSIIKSLQ